MNWWIRGTVAKVVSSDTAPVGVGLPVVSASIVWRFGSSVTGTVSWAASLATVWTTEAVAAVLGGTRAADGWPSSCLTVGSAAGVKVARMGSTRAKRSFWVSDGALE